jgi:hypothetical protein
MSFALSLTQSQALTALRSVLLTALPSGIEVVQAEDNQVSEPIAPDFVVMQPIMRGRLGTNISSYQDCAFTGSISGTVLTVSALLLGSINVVAQPPLFGPSVLSGTVIAAQTGGASGGAGTYTVSQAQTIASGPLASGVFSMMQPTQLTVQCDVHGPNSADYVQMFSTLLRSSYGCDLFAATGYDVTPLYAGDPRQTPFQNAEQQIERMWNCDVVLQTNSIVFVPQQFFAACSITVKPPVDATP